VLGLSVLKRSVVAPNTFTLIIVLDGEGDWNPPETNIYLESAASGGRSRLPVTSHHVI
jgi:hypothetical protein